jgi:hypothetical protein
MIGLSVWFSGWEIQGGFRNLTGYGPTVELVDAAFRQAIKAKAAS